MASIEEKLKTLPAEPGVYIMYDIENTIIYIGKAKLLKNRVRSYFNKNDHPIKVAKMVEHVHDFKYIITESELDALALEATLVKKHQPQYNILLKDDKHRPYIRIDVTKDFPPVEITRRVKNDGAKYFGPYMFGINVREVLEMIIAAFNLRTCTNTTFKHAKRPCINHHIERCIAPCSGNVSAEMYNEHIKDTINFLSGKNDAIKKQLEDKMQSAAMSEEFEAAIRYRDRLATLDKMSTRLTTMLPFDSDIDVFGYATNGEYSAVSVTNIRGGRMTGLTTYPIADAEGSDQESLSGFIMQFYLTNTPPSQIYLPMVIDDNDIITEYLNKKALRKVQIAVPARSIKKELVTNADKNALDYLHKSVDRIKYNEDMTIGAVNQLKKYLELSRVPKRIECYDISNISGTDKVASMVVSINGVKAQKEYRKFRIKTVEGQDDFASMREVLNRRLQNAKENDPKFSELPDLIVIDGGKGQLSAARTIMEELGFQIDIIGLAKREEEVFKPDRSEPYILPRESFALKCLIRVRDEAHRFAITYHRLLREKRNKPSKAVKKSAQKNAL